MSSSKNVKGGKSGSGGTSSAEQVEAKSGRNQKGLTADIYDYFTPLYRAKYASEDLATEPGSSADLGSSPGLVKWLLKTSKTFSSPSGSKSSSTKQEELQENEEVDPRAAQLKLWTLAEKKLPRLPPSTSAAPDGNNSAGVKANFFEIELDASVNLFKYSITIEEQKPASTVTQPTGTPPAQEGHTEDQTRDEALLDRRLLEAQPPFSPGLGH
ncbi:hypothetical protein BKA64DRAFT_756681 [Cadophora sp. MPI-SDFR-AT-0126]|nr:hypothetical protein BKA64DRAFT_756681 [Leotiomycetes sp. MPI-SDFR-AT-0126]